MIRTGPFERLQVLRKLHTLILRRCDIGAEGAKAIAAGIKTSSTLRILNLKGNPLMEIKSGADDEDRYDGFGALAQVLPTCAVLASVDLSGTRLGGTVGTGPAVLAPALQSCASLLSLK